MRVALATAFNPVVVAANTASRPTLLPISIISWTSQCRGQPVSERGE